MSKEEYHILRKGQKGTMLRFSLTTDYGFLVNDDDGDEIFVHWSRCRGMADRPKKGDKVTYDLMKDVKRRRVYADNVRPV